MPDLRLGVVQETACRGRGKAAVPGVQTLTAGEEKGAGSPKQVWGCLPQLTTWGPNWGHLASWPATPNCSLGGPGKRCLLQRHVLTLIDAFIENLLFSLKGKRKENGSNLTRMPVVNDCG